MHSHSLSGILKASGNVKGIIVYAPAMEWNFPLKQRPHHLALHMAQRGYLVFYCVKNLRWDNFQGFHQVAGNCYLTDRHDDIIAGDFPYIYLLSSVSDLTIDISLVQKIREDHVFLYDYLDAIEDVISGPGSSVPLLKRHKSINPDAVLCTADHLFREMLGRLPQDRVFLLPNAADYDHFHKKRDSRAMPEEMKGIRNEGTPVIGYFGAFAQWLDYEMINLLTLQHPGWNYVFLGWDHDGSMKCIEMRDNVFLIPSVPYAVLPWYAVWFDVALIPFRTGTEVAQTTSPIKLYEYMSLSVPIVASDMAECRKYKSVLIAENRDDFPSAIEKALSLRENIEYLGLLDREAKENDWNARARHFDGIITRQYHARFGRDLATDTERHMQPYSEKRSLHTDSVPEGTPLVSVIIPTCNRPEMLREAIGSVLDQTYRNFEIIIINDGGNDVDDIVAELNREGKIAVLSHAEKKGPSAARNSGLNKAKGKYICYLDDDDIYYPHHIETVMSYLERSSGKVAYTDANRALQVKINNRYVTTERAVIFNRDFDTESLLVDNYIHISTLCHEKALLGNTGYFDEELRTHEDWDFCIRLSRHHSFSHIGITTAEFRIRLDNSNTVNSKLPEFLDTLRLIHARYAHLITSPEISEKQRKTEEDLARKIGEDGVIFPESNLESDHRMSYIVDFVRGKRTLYLFDGNPRCLDAVAGTSGEIVAVSLTKSSQPSGGILHDNITLLSAIDGILPIDSVRPFDTAILREQEINTGRFAHLLPQMKQLLSPDGVFIIMLFCNEAANSSGETETGVFTGQVMEFFPNIVCFRQETYSLSRISSSDSVPGKFSFDSAALFSVPRNTFPACSILFASEKNTFSSLRESFSVGLPEREKYRRDEKIIHDFMRGKSDYLAGIERALNKSNAELKTLHRTISEKTMYFNTIESDLEFREKQASQLELIAGERAKHIEGLEQVLGEKDEFIREQNNTIHQQSEVIEGQTKSFHDVRIFLQEKQEDIRKLQEKLDYAEKQIPALQANIIEKERDINNLRIEYHELLRKFSHLEIHFLLMRDSITWRMVSAFHKHIVERFMPQGRGMRRRYDRAISSIRSFLSGRERPPSNNGNQPSPVQHQAENPDPYRQWITINEPNEEELHIQRTSRFGFEPTISIVVPVYNPPERNLLLMLESVIEQTYANWELCIADGGSNAPYVKTVLQKYSASDPRIRVHYLDRNTGIAGNSNKALTLSTGEYIALLDHDDLLAPFALYEVVKTLNANRSADFIYSDRDKILPDGTRIDPFFKPDWSPDYLLAQNYLCHLTVFARELADRTGGFREGFDGSQDYDLFLRLTENAQSIVHIPKILYHWSVIEGSASGDPDAKIYAYDAAIRALSDAAVRRGWNAVSIQGEVRGLYRMVFSFDRHPKISIVIPTKDNVDILRICINSILTKSTYPNFEILLIDNGSSDAKISEYYNEIQSDSRIHVHAYNHPFNFSDINNFGVGKASRDSEYIVFLNNDTEIITPNWLEIMLGFAQRDTVGGVGPKLLYPDNTIQTAGLILDAFGNVKRSHYRYPRFELGYAGRILSVQNVYAVAAACMMMRKGVFDEIGGFDPEFVIAHGDIDLCLKIYDRGYFIVYEPHAELYHHESYTRGYENTPEKVERLTKETELLLRKWGHVLSRGDPFFNPNLTAENETFSIKI